MANMPFTDADREIARNIMAQAEDRAAVAAPAESPAEPPQRTRTLTNRRGAAPHAADVPERAKAPIGNKVVAGVVGGLVLALALIALANQFSPASRPLGNSLATLDTPAAQPPAPPQRPPRRRRRSTPTPRQRARCSAQSTPAR